ncbi:hypothetical protein [Shewanella sp. 10N.286.52.B9]|uniref:hypothetical protein n=1 Tax=Shewanella sp. 10N.286.52.B9 TaxID=1880837 RepID=UPI000C81B550|nr:hypothetical protein [Shewanella sp. 10N.286.52.B9]PMG48065.1 hypothetical protein BCU91_02980 [Shewanella sp. 10N.286.52.B9]
MNQIVLRLAIVLIASLSMAECRLGIAAQGANQQFGSWENKDEDGDGIPDEQDDYPFDANQSSYKSAYEKEFNNNVSQANRVGSVPFRVHGTISESRDIDDFKFSVSEAQILADSVFTFILYKDNQKFVPSMVVIKDDGNVLQVPHLPIANVGRIGSAISFKPVTQGNYNISITDFNGNNGIDFTYALEAFVDRDIDGIADLLEPALGIDSTIQDTDSDGILDGNEFNVFADKSSRDLDVDRDGIPNWLDTDSDGDGILDKLEGSSNADADHYPNFVDVDSDNNTVSDNEDFDDVMGYSQDSDGDSVPDYADLDDDGDLLLDINDSDSKLSINMIDKSADKAVRIKTVQSKINGYPAINKIMADKPTFIYGNNFDTAAEVIIVLNKLDNSGKTTNIKVNPKSEKQIEFITPDYGDIAFGGEDVDIFVVIGSKRTEKIRTRLLDPKTPQLHSLTPLTAEAGEVITIHGQHLAPGTKLVINNAVYSLKKLRAKSAQFTLPQTVTSGHVSLENQYGISESIFLNIGKVQDIVIKAPVQFNQMTGPFRLSMVKETFTNLSDIQGYKYPIHSAKPDTLLVSNGSHISFLRAIMLPSDPQVVFSLDSTIKAMALTSFIRGKNETEVRRALEVLPQLASYKALRDFILHGIETDIEATFDLGNMSVAVKIYDVSEELKQLNL